MLLRNVFLFLLMVIFMMMTTTSLLFFCNAQFELYDSIFLPTNNLPETLTENVRVYTINKSPANDSLVYMAISDANLIVFDLNNLDITVLGGLPFFTDVGQAIIKFDPYSSTPDTYQWILFSFDQTQIRTVDIQNINNINSYSWSGCAYCSVVDVITYPDNDLSDVNGTFWILTDSRTILEFDMSCFNNSVNGVISPIRASSIPPFNMAGFNTAIYSVASDSLYVASVTGVIVRFDVASFTWATTTATACDATSPHVDTIQIDDERSLLYVPCPGRSSSSSLGYAPSSLSRINISDVNNLVYMDNLVIPAVNDTVLQYNPSLSYVIPETDISAMFLDFDGNCLYISLQPTENSFATDQGAVVQVCQMDEPTYFNPLTNLTVDPRQVQYLFLQETFEELFQGSVFDGRDQSSRWGYVMTSPLPTSLSQVGRVAQLELPEACPDGCFHGTCVRGVCECTAPYLGETCLNSCPPSCGSGTCGSDGICICDDGYFGLTCSIQVCPHNCNGNGYCDHETNLCQCYTGFFGDDCSSSVCKATQCVDCISPQCYWCNSAVDVATGRTGLCLTIGSPIPGTNHSCPIRETYSDVCQYRLSVTEAGTTVLSIVFCLLLIYDMWSAVKDDRQPVGRVYARQSWWRSQRSAKLYAIVDQFQYIALVGCVGVTHPRLWATFSSGFAWSNLWINPGWKLSYDKKVGKGVYQLSRDSGIYPDYFFYSNLFWLVITFAIFLIPMVLIIRYRNFKLTDTGEDVWPFAKERLVYIAVRLSMFVHMGISLSASYEALEATNGGRKFFACVVLLFCVAVPVLVRVLFVKNPKGMLQKEFRKQFGSLYESLNIKKLWYASVPSATRVIYALLIGLTQNIPALGVAIVIIIKFVYLIQLMFFKPRPFLDPSFMFLDVVRTFLDILTIGLVLVFSNASNNSATQTLRSTATVSSVAAEAIMIGMQLVCVLMAFITFLVAWAGMHNIHTISHVIETMKTGKTPRRRDIELSELQKTQRKKEAQEEAKVNYTGAGEADRHGAGAGAGGDGSDGADNGGGARNAGDRKESVASNNSSTSVQQTATVGAQVVINVPNNRKSGQFKTTLPPPIQFDGPVEDAQLPPVFVNRSTSNPDNKSTISDNASNDGNQ